ncbi:YbaB/EbfC family DNA-binding protein [Mycolicibacterium fluoranthenivorans]|uniref:YbaB/EbfC family DNA-binding protein n=1 Tax=Mycolicibacterium fluoranthenivorans TaxID=258505 RepID=UPI0014224130|nr:YbaB/EbfC family DNA-binding protein [Mycolicibacterium fluoranthenivorans]MCV7353856.1 YbaB/EbfC family DNA-binding protein [Mycolicibacterium fluoranthenivorans]
MVGTPSYDDDDYPHPGGTEDGFDELVGLDFAAGDAEAVDQEGSVFDAFSVFDAGLPAPVDDDEGPAEEDLDADVAVFSVTNPPGTVTVTALMDGRVQRIELAPAAVLSTEAQLADEIVVIAGLATAQARSAQFTYMLEGMRREGQDDVVTRDFLKRDLDLPSPEEADAAQAHVFATRYAGDHD